MIPMKTVIQVHGGILVPELQKEQSCMGTMFAWGWGVEFYVN